MSYRPTADQSQNAPRSTPIAIARVLTDSRELKNLNVWASRHELLEDQRKAGQREQLRRRRMQLALAMLGSGILLLIAFAWASTASAQATEYDVLPYAAEFETSLPEGMDPSSREARTYESERRRNRGAARRTVLDIMADKVALAGNETTFDNWYRGGLFADMTQTSEESLATLGEQRDVFFDQYVRRAKNQEAITRLVETLAFVEMRKIVEGNFHPAVQVNAMTIIGMLDSRPGSHNTSAPVPYRPAMTFLMEKLKAADVPDHLKVVALTGIQRHAMLDGQRPENARIPQAQRDDVVNAMLAILESPPEDRHPQAQAWMERQAIRTLGYMKMTGQDDAVAKVLYERLIGEYPPGVKVDAARAYGNLQFANAAAANPKEVSLKIAELTVAAARGEVAYLGQTSLELEELAIWRQTPTTGVNTGPGAPGDKGGGGAPGRRPGGAGSGSGSAAPARPGGMGGGNGSAGGSSAPGLGGLPGIGGGEGDVPSNPFGGGGDKGGGGFPGRGSQGNAAASDDPGAIPNYVAMISRRRIKYVLDAAQGAIGDGNGLSKYTAGSADEELMKKIREAMKKVSDASNVGLNPDEEDGSGVDPVDAYSDALEEAANGLERVIETARAASSGAGGGDQPAKSATGFGDSSE